MVSSPSLNASEFRLHVFFKDILQPNANDYAQHRHKQTSVKAYNIAKITFENLTISLEPQRMGWKKNNQSMYLTSQILLLKK